MGLKEKVTEDMKAAMRARDAQRLGAIRLLTAAITQKGVDERIEIHDAHVQTNIDKMIQQSSEPNSQFEAGDQQLDYIALGPQHRGDGDLVKDWWTD